MEAQAGSRSLFWAVVGTLASYAIMELYLALRPPDLSDQIQAYLSSSKGRFEAWLAEQNRPPAPEWERGEE